MMNCPFKYVAFEIKDATVEHYDVCSKAECALWDEYYQCCGLVTHVAKRETESEQPKCLQAEIRKEGKD